MSDKNNKSINLWCEVCNYLLLDEEDVISSKENNCCFNCWLTFGEMRKKEWKEGWRPDKATLSRYIQERRIVNTDVIKKILGEI
jgi:hypothetical protein